MVTKPLWMLHRHPELMGPDVQGHGLNDGPTAVGPAQPRVAAMNPRLKSR